MTDGKFDWMYLTRIGVDDGPEFVKCPCPSGAYQVGDEIELTTLVCMFGKEPYVEHPKYIVESIEEDK